MAVNKTIYQINENYKVWEWADFTERTGVDIKQTLEIKELLMDKNNNIDSSISLYGIKDTSAVSTFYLPYKVHDDLFHNYDQNQLLTKMFGINITDKSNLSEVKFEYPEPAATNFVFDSRVNGSLLTVNKNTYTLLGTGYYGTDNYIGLEYNNYNENSNFYYYSAGLDKLEMHPKVAFKKWIKSENRFDDAFGEVEIYFKDINRYINEEKEQNEFCYVVVRFDDSWGIRVEHEGSMQLKVPAERFYGYETINTLIYRQYADDYLRYQSAFDIFVNSPNSSNYLNYDSRAGFTFSENYTLDRLQYKKDDEEGGYARLFDVTPITMRHVPIAFTVSEYFNFDADYYKEVYIPAEDNACGWFLKFSKETDDSGKFYLSVKIKSNIFSLKLLHDTLTYRGIKLNPDVEEFPTSYENYWWPKIQGQYIEGTWAKGIVEANKNSTTIDYNNSEYKDNPSPTGPVGPGGDYTPPIDSGVLDNVPSLSGLSFFTNMYCLSYSAIKSLSAELYTADDSKIQEFLDGLKLMGSNPIDAIVSIKLYPFNFDALSYTSQSFWQNAGNTIRFGRTDITVSDTVYKASGFGSIVLDAGAIRVPRKHNSFLDFEPYSKVLLWLPYCGFVNLSFSEISDKTLSVKYFVDLLSGTAMACVYIDNRLYNNIQTQLSIELPITSTQNSSKAINTAMSMLQPAVTAAFNPSAAIVQEINAISQSVLTSNQTNFHTKGNYNSNLYQLCDQRVLLIHETPQIENLDYQNSEGFIINEYKTISEMQGYCTFTNAKLDFNATENEKQEIQTLLERGVFI